MADAQRQQGPDNDVFSHHVRAQAGHAVKGVLDKPHQLQHCVSPPTRDTIKVPWSHDDQPSPQSSSSHSHRPSSDASSDQDLPAVWTPRSCDVARVPAYAIPIQSSLLKQINSARSKEELLAFISRYVYLLDHINQVTCLYRLAKLCYNSRGRSMFLQELQAAAPFRLLLRCIDSSFLRAHFKMLGGQDIRGLDARCLSNLVWSLIKLDLPADSESLTTSIALNVIPLVVRSLDTCSPQALANMLWAYSKLPATSMALMDVITRLVVCITQQLKAGAGTGNRHFDAQALSNSVWAIAHLKGRGVDVEPTAPVLLGFVEALSQAAGSMLSSMQQRADLGNLQVCVSFLCGSENNFSCQALVNIAWSLATLLGPTCGSHSAIRQLFNLIHTESVNRLHASVQLLRAGRPLPYFGASGGFNEQALSNAVFAFDKAGLLCKDLLEGIFTVAALRLAQSEREAHISFKPQELCTLLKACHNSVAAPWVFLTTLFRVIMVHPHTLGVWGSAEHMELQRAYQLYRDQHQSAGTPMPHFHVQLQNILATTYPSSAPPAASMPMSMPLPPHMQYAAAAVAAAAQANVMAGAPQQQPMPHWMPARPVA